MEEYILGERRVKIYTYSGNIDNVAEIVNNVSYITFHFLQQRLLLLNHGCLIIRLG
jgi:hypothetical protein